MEFKTEVNQLLELMIHSLYSNKEIFLRELISNSSDALDKLNFLTLSDEAYKGLDFDPKIELILDKEAKTFVLRDNGFGMSEDELKTNLGTIAKSGTKSFIESLSGDKQKDSKLIGQFGVGFYSAFMVADKIEVLSRKPLSDEAFLWTSDTKGFEVSKSSMDGFGTQITLHMKDEDFLDAYRVENVVEKYSNHIQFPIYLEKDEEIKQDEPKEGEEVPEPKFEKKFIQINKAKAIWTLNKTALKKEDYENFYKQNFHDSEAPLLHIHTKAEGKLEYDSLFFIPSKAAFDLFRVDYQSQLKLYVKRVFISDDDKELLPSWLRFVCGIIDVASLPLNVSREILQENVILKSIKEVSTKKILSELAKIKTKKIDEYLSFWREFGKALKEGLYGFSEHKEKLLDLMLYKSALKGELISLAQYKEGMKEDQSEIFFLAGKDEAILKNSPLLEEYKEKGVDVLLMSDEIDSIIMPMIGEFEGLKFQPINQLESKDELSDEAKAEFAPLVAKIKESLKDDVADVRLSTRLAKSPACIVYDKNQPDFAMQSLMKQMGQEVDIKPILELNPNHAILSALKGNETFTSDLATLLLNMAKLSEGMSVKDPASFNEALAKVITKALS